MREQLAFLALQRADTAAAEAHLQAGNILDGVLPSFLAADHLQPASPDAATLLPTPDAPGLSLDHLSISPCGRLLQLDGWLIDAQQHLAALILRRPGQVLRCNLESLSRRVRPDLSDLLSDRGLPTDHSAGFSVHLVLGVEEAVAPTPDELCTLFLLRHDGGFVAVGRPLRVVPPSPTELSSIVSPLLFSAEDPTDMAAWNA